MRLHVHEWGDPSNRAILCIHGITGHGGRFRRFAAALPGFHVYAPDLRGHGRSDWEPPWDLEAHAGDVLDTMEALGLDRVDVVGHSFGGRLALELAARHPDRFGRLALLDPAVWVPPPIALERAEGLRPDESFADAEEAITVRLETGTPLTPRDLLAEELPEHLEPGPDGRLRYRYARSAVIAAYGEMSKPPPLAAVQSEILIVRGRDSDVLPELLAEAAIAELPHARLHDVPGGHIVLWDAFDETVAAARAFLTS